MRGEDEKGNGGGEKGCLRPRLSMGMGMNMDGYGYGLGMGMGMDMAMGWDGMGWGAMVHGLWCGLLSPLLLLSSAMPWMLAMLVMYIDWDGRDPKR